MAVETFFAKMKIKCYWPQQRIGTVSMMIRRDRTIVRDERGKIRRAKQGKIACDDQEFRGAAVADKPGSLTKRVVEAGGGSFQKRGRAQFLRNIEYFRSATDNDNGSRPGKRAGSRSYMMKHFCRQALAGCGGKYRNKPLLGFRERLRG